MSEQLSLLDLPPAPWVEKFAANLREAGRLPEPPPEQPKALPTKDSTGCQHGAFATGDVALVHHLYPDNSREKESDFYWAGAVIGYNSVGYVLVNTGAGQPYPCPEERLTKYDGVVNLWRLGQMVVCDRPDCEPHQSARPFTCQQCEARSQPHWWYVGEMSTEPTAPRWPDSVWFPAGYDPNERRFEE